MPNKPRQCEKCSYRTNSAAAMIKHGDNTGHNKTKKENKYVQLGKMWKKVK